MLKDNNSKGKKAYLKILCRSSNIDIISILDLIHGIDNGTFDLREIPDLYLNSLCSPIIHSLVCRTAGLRVLLSENNH